MVAASGTDGVALTVDAPAADVSRGIDDVEFALERRGMPRRSRAAGWWTRSPLAGTTPPRSLAYAESQPVDSRRSMTSELRRRSTGIAS
jgi:hypothetical protein